MKACLGLLLWAAALLCHPLAQAAHAVAQFGTPKYPAGFSHFDYVNPDAPKQGVVNFSLISQNSSFDKFNPFTLKGKPAPGLVELMFETLTVYSLDEMNTQYGLLAEDIAVAPDFGAVTFRLHPTARFSNGDAVTARDVEHSYKVLTGRGASPRFKSYFADIDRLVVVDRLTVRFEFKRKGRDLSFIAGSLPVFSPKWGLRADGSRVPFDELRLEQPIASGPYTVQASGTGQNVIYTRNPDYWARDLPVRRGAFNFDQVVYKLYKDKDTLVSAIRAGDFDFFPENQMRYWCCQFIGQRFDSGELVKEKIRHHNPRPMNGYAFNMRRQPFDDLRVRKALSYAYDWDWLNRMVFDDEFKRQDSYFANTPLAASGLPSEAERALLEPYRASLPPEVFGPMLQQPSTKAPSSLRQNLAKAVDLLAQAGWHNRDGVLRNAAGQPLVIEVSGRGGVLLDAYYYNLAKLGVVVKQRSVDATAERVRMRKFDYDFASTALRESRMAGPELWRAFNSKDADVEGSENIVGVKSPVVDHLLGKLLDANDEAETLAAAHALDRVLIHNFYVLPWRYLENQYFIYNRRLKRPATTPLYFGSYEWVIGAWWDSEAAPAGKGR